MRQGRLTFDIIRSSTRLQHLPFFFSCLTPATNRLKHLKYLTYPQSTENQTSEVARAEHLTQPSQALLAGDSVWKERRHLLTYLAVATRPSTHSPSEISGQSNPDRHLNPGVSFPNRHVYVASLRTNVTDPQCIIRTPEAKGAEEDGQHVRQTGIRDHH